MTKGGINYVIKELLEEIDNTKKMYSLEKSSEAQRKIVEDLRLGRQLKIKIIGRL